MKNSVALLLQVMAMFAKAGPALQEVETVLPALFDALGKAKNGQAWSVSVPITEDGVKGNFSFGFSPDAA